MFNKYFIDEITIMPNFLKKKYIRSIRSLIKNKNFSPISDAVKTILSSGNTAETSLKTILKDHKDLMLESYSNIEETKSFKYSAIFELDDEREPIEIINQITKNNTILDSTIHYNTIISDYKATKMNDLLKFTFLLDGFRMINGNPVPIKTTYSVIVKFWTFGIDDEKRKFIEIDTDNVASYFRIEKNNFFEQMINNIAEYLQTEFSLSLHPVDLLLTLERIKDKEKKGELKNFPKASAQKMVLSSGSQAVLDSNDAETIILPILGELKNLIEDNQKLFSQAIEVKKLLEEFIRDTEVMSDLPWITFTWDDIIKSKKIQVKFVLSEYPYTLLNYYIHKKGRKGMNDVIESLLKEYSSKKINEDDEG